MTIAKVQTVGGAASTTAQASFTSTSTSFTAGNLLVAVASWGVSGAGTVLGPISTPAGWTQVKAANNGANTGSVWLGFLPNNAGGAQSWTWNYSQTGYTIHDWAYQIIEFSGAARSSVLGLSQSNAPAKSTTLDSGIATGTTLPTDLVIAGMSWTNASDVTGTAFTSSVPSSGWNMETHQNSTGLTPFNHVFLAWQVLTAAVTNPDCIVTSTAPSAGVTGVYTIATFHALPPLVAPKSILQAVNRSATY